MKENKMEKDKELLLRDLCARLPYGVIVHNEEGYEGHINSINQTIFGIELGVNITATRRVDFQLDTCKPYLRPMSSMTEEEEKEYELLANRCIATSIGFVYLESQTLIDWLNSHHFDYRGLIEKGLALEAMDGMYETEVR